MNSLLLLCFLVGPALAKDPCKIVTKATDLIDGPVSGYVVYFDKGHFTAFDIQHRKGAYTLHLLTVVNGTSPITGALGDPAHVVVGSQVVDLMASAASPPISNANQYQVFTQWVVAYDISIEQLANLATAPITAIGMNVGTQEFRLPIKEKDAEKLQIALTCMAKDE